MNEDPLAETPPLTPALPPALPPDVGPSWFQRLSSILFVVFCFELGLFLLIYPWTEAWTENYFSIAVPDQVLTTWRTWWNNPYVRGGVSGLGMVNVWIALAEVFQMFAGRRRN